MYPKEKEKRKEKSSSGIAVFTKEGTFISYKTDSFAHTNDSFSVGILES